MIPFIEDCYFYKRIDSILIAVKTTGEEVPVVKFKQKFIDLQIVDKEPLAYIKRYIEMHPELVEIIELKTQTEQLKLF
jgi:phage regulator Rha-like protein